MKTDRFGASMLTVGLLLAAPVACAASGSDKNEAALLSDRTEAVGCRTAGQV